MISVPQVTYCDRCGHDAERLNVSVTYVRDARLYRANQVHPCGCMLGIVDVTFGDPQRNRRAWRRPNVARAKEVSA